MFHVPVPPPMHSKYRTDILQFWCTPVWETVKQGNQNECHSSSITLTITKIILKSWALNNQNHSINIQGFILDQGLLFLPFPCRIAINYILYIWMTWAVSFVNENVVVMVHCRCTWWIPLFSKLHNCWITFSLTPVQKNWQQYQCNRTVTVFEWIVTVTVLPRGFFHQALKLPGNRLCTSLRLVRSNDECGRKIRLSSIFEHFFKFFNSFSFYLN